MSTIITGDSIMTTTPKHQLNSTNKFSPGTPRCHPGHGMNQEVNHPVLIINTLHYTVVIYFDNVNFHKRIKRMHGQKAYTVDFHLES